MRHYKNLLNESMSLTVFEMLTMLQNFLHEKYGIKAFGAKEDNGFVMYMSKYLDEQDRPINIAEEIKKFVEKDCNMENVEVHKDKYGYHITFGHNAQSAKLIETTQTEMTQADGSGIAGAKTTYKCSFCEEDHEGYGNDPWPVDMDPQHRVCDNCNNEVVIPARLEQLFKKESVNEAVERDQVEKDASNIVLDSKYTWLFNVLDKNGRDLEEGIDNLQEAIDLLIKDDAAFLVAFPYVDPKPNDPTVELIFADNPGPVIIYNNEEVTVPKKQLERPTTERPEKPNRPERQQEEAEDEEVVEEAKDWEAGSGKGTKRTKKQWVDHVMEVIDYITKKGIRFEKQITENDMSKLTMMTALPAGDIERILNFIFNAKQGQKMKLDGSVEKESVETEDSETIMEAAEDDMMIDTGLTGNKNKEILNSVLGQLSDGAWEGSRAMEKYWQNIKVIEKNGRLYLTANTYRLNKSLEEIKVWFAKKIKDIIKMEINDDEGKPGQWSRGNDYVSAYMGYNEKITIADAYKAYETMLGRQIQGRYGEALEAEDSETITEAAQEDFIVALDLTGAWYDMMDELEVGQEPYEAIKEMTNSLEDYLAYKKHFVSFDYVGQRQFDVASNPLTREEAEEIEMLLEDYLGEWAVVKVISKNY